MRLPLVLLLLLAAIGGVFVALRSQSAPGVDPEGSYLDQEQRLVLFDIERADRLLGISLKPFLRGLQEGDEEAMRRSLASDFRAIVPAVSPDMGALEEGRFYRSDILEGREELDAEGFIAWALEFGRVFDELDTASFPRYLNSREIIEGSAARAESRGAFRIAGRTGETGLLEMSGSFKIIHDGFERYGEDDDDIANADAQLVDNWIHVLELEEASLVASVNSLFRDATESAGIDLSLLHDNWTNDTKPDTTFSGGIYLGEVNGDGHLDALVAEVYDSRLYFGKGDGTFVDSGWSPPVVEVEGVMEGREVRTAIEPQVAIFDATGDGRVEVLFCGMLFGWNPTKGKMTPVPMTIDIGPKKKARKKLPAADAALCDYDRDGLVDIYFLNSGPRPRKELRKEYVAWFDDERVSGTANDLYKNLGGGKFKKVTREANAAGGHGRTFAAVWFYANQDEWPDLFGANEFGRNVFLVNQGDGTFEEADDVDDVFGGFSMGVTSGDLDGDGLSDLYVSNMYSKAGQRVYAHLDLSIYPESARRMFMSSVTGNRVYRSNGDLTFENQTTFAGANAVGWAWSGAVLDVDLDGWLDVYAPCGYRSIDADKPDG